MVKEDNTFCTWPPYIQESKTNNYVFKHAINIEWKSGDGEVLDPKCQKLISHHIHGNNWIQPWFVGQDVRRPTNNLQTRDHFLFHETLMGKFGNPTF